MNKKKKTIIIVALLLVVFIGSISYALWSVTLEQTDSNIVKTGCFTVDMVEQTDEINLPEEYPVTDAEGRKYSPFTFTIQNTCTIDSSYSVNLKVEDGTTLEHQYVKAVLDGDKAQVLTDYEKATDEDKYQLTTGTLAGASAEGAGDGESVTYNLRLWLDADTPKSQMSKDFYAKIVIENITTSGVEAREVLATGDISEVQDGSVTYAYYTTGELEISGIGRMADTSVLEVLFGQLISKQEFVNKLTTDEKEVLNSEMMYTIVSALTNNYFYMSMVFGDEAPICLKSVTSYDEYQECLSSVEINGEKVFTDVHKTLMDKFKESFSSVTSIKISEGINKIGKESLGGFNVEEILLPSTVEELGVSAFEGSEIDNIYLNTGLKKIGNGAFSYCKIPKIVIPDTVTELGTAFGDTANIAIKLPKNNEFTNLQNYIFEGTENLTIIIPDTISNVDAYAFANSKNNILYLEASEDNKPVGIGDAIREGFVVNYNYSE